MKIENSIQIIDLLSDWYQKNKRDLPWRKNKNAYLIWVSEIMLQQTRVEYVIPYFEKFTKRLPTLKALAMIPEDDLMKLWEGLGYYSRVLFMQKCAQDLIESGREALPNTYRELLKLPGIGPYTAGAIASIAHDEAVSAVDGNVLRVISRLLASEENVSVPKTRKEIEELLNKIMPKESGNFNQALMELGATICIPGNPRCNICPLNMVCKGYEKGNMWKLPIKDQKKNKKEENWTVVILIYQNKIAIRKRPKKGLLASLWEFPNYEGFLEEKDISDIYTIHLMKKTRTYRHVFTHKIWNMEGYIVFLEALPENDHVWTTLHDLQEKYSIPTAFSYFIEDLKQIDI